jgi:hypothetical protein
MITTTKVLLTSLAAAVACTVTAYAKENADKKPVDADKKKANKEKRMKLYDTDNDGKLNKEEKKKMKEAKNKGKKGKKDKKDKAPE